MRLMEGMLMDNNNNFNYADEGYGFDSFSQNANNAQYGDNMYNNYTGPTGFAGLQTIVMEKVVAKSFLFMVAALIITGFAALTTSPMVAIRMLSGGAFFVLLVAELAIVFAGNWAVRENKAVLAAVLYTVYSFITGMTLSIIFLAYTGASIVNVFFITAGMFATMAVIGLTTKKDLTGIGSLCLMGLIGIILAGIVNLFIRSSMFDFGIAVVGVIIFVGLTAYDVQKVKQMAAYSTDLTENSLALFGAFQLYLDFINLFLKLLRILGKRK